MSILHRCAIFSPVKRNNCAKAAIEGGIWDAYAKIKGVPLHQLLGGVRNNVEAGVSIGIQDTPDQLVSVVDNFLNEGYKRIKIKIKREKITTILLHCVRRLVISR